MVAHILLETWSNRRLEGWGRERERERRQASWILIIIAAMRVVFQSLMGRFFLLIEGQTD
jgi:hypothetical protein